MAIVSMTQALKDKDKVFVGDAPCCITAPGKMGMMVGAGDTLTKLVQIIALRDQFGDPKATTEQKAKDLTMAAGEVLLESNLFMNADFGLGNRKRPSADQEELGNRQKFDEMAFELVYCLITLMDLAKVDTEFEKAQMEGVAAQVGGHGRAQDAKNAAMSIPTTSLRF